MRLSRDSSTKTYIKGIEKMRCQDFLKRSGEKINKFLNWITKDRTSENLISEYWFYTGFPKLLWICVNRIFIVAGWILIIGAIMVLDEISSNTIVEKASRFLLFVFVIGISTILLQIFFPIMKKLFSLLNPLRLDTLWSNTLYIALSVGVVSFLLCFVTCVVYPEVSSILREILEAIHMQYFKQAQC